MPLQKGIWARMQDSKQQQVPGGTYWHLNPSPAFAPKRLAFIMEGIIFPGYLSHRNLMNPQERRG
jgi:hypothetical protein